MLRLTIKTALSKIEIRNPSLTQSQSYGVINDDFTFTASAKNKSKSKVTALRLNVTALDCPTEDARAADCDIVGHSDGTFSTDIPAGEVRRIDGRFTLTAMPKPSGVFSPRFVVKGVRAAIDAADPADDAWLRDFTDQKNIERGRVMCGSNWFTPQQIEAVRERARERATRAADLRPGSCPK